MARVTSPWHFKKGAEAWHVVEQICLSPAPKLGGWAGKQLRFLSISRGQSVITDIEQGSLAMNRRCTGLPSMQRMWFHHRGFSLGYTKPRGSPEPAELFFFDPEARLWAQPRLPAGVADASAGMDQWFVARRDGHVYACSLQGWPQWNELIPYPPRDESTNAMWGLPIFHPRLRLAVGAGILFVGAGRYLHGYCTSGERLWTTTLPPAETSAPCTFSTDLPTRQDRLLRLGLGTDQEQVRTGYRYFDTPPKVLYCAGAPRSSAAV
jgi:hypothetical protein